MIRQGSTAVVGDIVQVKKIELTGLLAKELWINARVCYIDDQKVGVMYDDGRQEMFERRSGFVRI